MLLRPFIALGIVAGLLAGCDGTEVLAPVLEGRYEGIFTYQAEPGPFSPGGEMAEPWVLTLEEKAGGEVAGTGSLGTLPVEIAGTYDHPDVTLTFTDALGNFTGRFTGRFEGGQTLDGVYNYNLFFINQPVSLTRQP